MSVSSDGHLNSTALQPENVVPRRKQILSLRSVFAFAVGIPVLLLLGLLLVYEYSCNRIESAQKMRDLMAREVISRAKTLDHHLAMMTRSPDQIAKVITIRKPENLDEMLSFQHTMLADNPNIFGSVIAWEPFAFDSKEKHFCPYVWRDAAKNGAVSYKMFNPANDYDYLTGWDWYENPKRLYAGKPDSSPPLSENTAKDGRVPRIEFGLWTPPYYDDGGGEALMCTYSVPFFSEQQFAGVVTCDITTDWIANFLSKKVFSGGYFILLGINGEIISSPLPDYAMKDIGDIVRSERLEDWYGPIKIMESFARSFRPQSAIDNLPDNDSIYISALSLEISDFMRRNRQVWLEVAKIPSTGWLLVYSVPKETVYETVNARFIGSVLYLIMGLTVFCAYLFWHINRRIISPLQDLSRATRAVADRNFNHQIISEHIGGSELLELEENFNTMTRTLRQSIDDAVQNAADKERAEASSKAKSEILMLAGHELRTPLSGTMGATDLLLQTELTPKQQEYINLQKVSNTSLLLLINNILDYSKLDFAAGKIHIEEKDFHLQNAVNSVGCALKLLADAKGITIKSEFDDRLPARVCGDEGRLRQLLSNLLGNAIKFSKDSKILVKITEDQRSALPDKRFLFEVIDHGVGIPPEHREQIFTQNKQENISNRTYDGMGLGLTISKSVTDTLHGTIGYRETPGGGSTFWFSIPFSEALTEEKEDNAPQSDADILQTEHNLQEKSRRILVAEDNRINRIVIKEILSKAGYECVMAEDGREAVEKWKTESFDLILMDCQMPDVDGYDATKQIRQIEQEENCKGFIPIVALTANAAPLDRELCLEIGMNAYLNKPIETPELLKTLQYWIQEKQKMFS